MKSPLHQPLNDKYRVAVLIRRQKHVWQSCNTIQANLIKSYQKTNHTCGLFYYEDHQSLNDDLLLVSQLKEFDPQVIAFVSNSDPNAVFRVLQKSLPALEQRRLIFHLYGDFLLNIHHWRKMGPKLDGLKVLFLAASESQKNVCSEFFHSPESVQILPFSVDRSRFKFNPEERAARRARMGIGPADKVILYAGRVSLQKNVDLILKALERIQDVSSKGKIHFLCAGDFDHLGAPFLKLGVTRDQIKNEILKLLELNQPMKSSLLGHVQQELLPPYYNSADLFVSLSTHHDEDFGMSAAEAMMCGSQTLLSHWGGYKSFANLQEHCKSVSVHRGIAGPEMSLDEISVTLQTLLNQKDTISQRQLRAEKFQKLHSVEAVAGSLDRFISVQGPVHKDLSSNWEIEHCFIDSLGQFLGEKYWRHYEHYI